MWEYPLRTGSDIMGHAIPDEMLKKMDTHVLEALAVRQYGPLLEKLDKAPDKFDEKVHDAARYGGKAEAIRNGAEMDGKESEITLLREEFEEFRQEMRDQVEELRNLISRLSSRRRSLFR